VLDLEGARTERTVARAIPGSPGRWILEIVGLAGRAAASALANAVVLVDRSCLGLAEGELLVSDLPGREIAEGGRTAGRIVSTFHNGAHDVLVVETLRGRVDFPLVEERVLGLDSSGRLEVEGFSDFQDLAYEPAETDP